MIHISNGNGALGFIGMLFRSAVSDLGDIYIKGSCSGIELFLCNFSKKI
jgi:hypothetical protein